MEVTNYLLSGMILQVEGGLVVIQKRPEQTNGSTGSLGRWGTSGCWKIWTDEVGEM